MQHERGNCYLNFAVMTLEHHKEEMLLPGACLPFPWCPGRQPVGIGGTRLQLCRFFSSWAQSEQSCRDLQCLPPVGGSHCGSCSSSTSGNIRVIGVVLLGRIAPGPHDLLRDTWAQPSQQLKTAKPTVSSQIPSFDGWWLKLANFILRLGSFPNMDKSLGEENQGIPPVNNKAWPSTFLWVHMWRGNGCSEIKQLKKKKRKRKKFVSPR